MRARSLSCTCEAAIKQFPIVKFPAAVVAASHFRAVAYTQSAVSSALTLSLPRLSIYISIPIPSVSVYILEKHESLTFGEAQNEDQEQQQRQQPTSRRCRRRRCVDVATAVRRHPSRYLGTARARKLLSSACIGARIYARVYIAHTVVYMYIRTKKQDGSARGRVAARFPRRGLTELVARERDATRRVTGALPPPRGGEREREPCTRAPATDGKSRMRARSSRAPRSVTPPSAHELSIEALVYSFDSPLSLPEGERDGGYMRVCLCTASRKFSFLRLLCFRRGWAERRVRVCEGARFRC